MVGIIVSQIILLMVFRLWPETKKEPAVFQTFENEAISVEEMVVTKQASAPAAPPRPQTPIPVPNDEVIEDIIEFPEFEDFLSEDPLGIELSTGQRGEEGKISGNPDRPPRIRRIVEPVIPDAAKNAGIKAMIVVNFTVSEEGKVLEAYVSEIRLFDDKGEKYEVVDDIGYGLLEATLEAAYKWQFLPAEEHDEKVGAYTQDIFSFGF